MNTLGSIGVWLGMLSALTAAGLALIGRSGDQAGKQAKQAAYYATIVAGIGMTIAVVVLAVAFFTKDYSIQYVAQQRSLNTSNLAWLFTLSGVWAGQSGSLLFWTWLMTLFSGYLALRNSGRDDEGGLHSSSLMVLNIIISVFGLLMLVTEGNNPFIPTPNYLFVDGQLVGMAAGWSMNPLLEHWAMILHPPTLFIGYAGLAVPFAYGLGALISGNTSTAWIKQSDRITVFSWLFLGIGIGLGAIWAYVELSFGGFWAWDPVENASILPWFVGVGLIHSMTVYRRRGNAKVWSFMLAALTFMMVIVGTFITRSGVFESVHSFPQDMVAYYIFLTLMIVSMASMAIAVWYRRADLRNVNEFDFTLGKDTMYYLNNIIMVFASVIILIMTVAPTLLRRDFLPAHYEVIARFLGLAYIAILAICPVLAWGDTDKETLWDRTKLPLALSAVPFGLLTWLWYVNLRPVYKIMANSGTGEAQKFTMYGETLYTIIALVGFALASFLIMNTLLVFVRGTQARAKAQNESFIKALGTVLIKARIQSGGYISHIAMGIIVIGLIGSVMYVQTQRFHIQAEPGAQFEVAGNTFTLESFVTAENDRGEIEKTANFEIERGGRNLGAIAPSVFSHAEGDGHEGEPPRPAHAIVKSFALEDLFVTLENFTESDGEVVGLTGRVDINPLIWFAWGGFILLIAGNALAAWPKKAPAALAEKSQQSAKKKKN